MSDQKERQKIKAFNIDLDTIGVEFNVRFDEIFATFNRGTTTCRVRQMPYFTINQMYKLWELMDDRMPRGQFGIDKPDGEKAVLEYNTKNL